MKEFTTKSETFLRERGSLTPSVSPHMAKVVSQWRRGVLEDEVASGGFREQGAMSRHASVDRHSNTPAGFVVSNANMYKTASVGQSAQSSGAGFRGSGGTLRQSPEIYSPLWLNSNLNLPRDRATINAWSRSFFALNPIVHNAITLHSTYPISRLNITCHNEKVQQFFEDMIEEIDLMNTCVQIAQEFWILGESFVYAELSESEAKWRRLLIQNPDYIVVKHSAVAGEPIISLRPDENLRRIVTSNKPSDLQQRQRLDPSIVEHVRRGENIPLSNFYVSHLARKISPYEIRGTGLITSSFRQLMLFDKLRECYSTDYEVLTKDGFQKITDLIELKKEITNPNYVNGASYDENGDLEFLTLKDGVEVACFNQETEELEYHEPEEFHLSRYKGEMIHFEGKKVDTLVTPNHKLLIKEKTNGSWGQLEKREASELFNKKKYYKFRCHAKWEGDNNSASLAYDHVMVAGHSVPIDLYLKVLGHMVSEGCVYSNYKNGRYDAKITMNQLTMSRSYRDMKSAFNKFASHLNRNCGNYISVKGSGYSKNAPKEGWEGVIHGINIVKHFLDEIGNGVKAGSHEKKLPRWTLSLKKDKLQILLNALMQGDGTSSISKYETKSKSFKYSTVSKKLADDIYELVFKLGYVPTICTSVARKSDDREVIEYIVCWSTTEYGREPLIYTGDKRQNNNGGGASVKKIDYDGAVWCFTVPTGAFVVRRNNKISIQGNCKFAQADNMINPLTLVKIGSDTYKPSPADLEDWRNVFEECHDEETEVLTDQGFMKFDEAIEVSNLLEGSTGTISKSFSSPKEGIKIACFNPDTEQLEYHTPTKANVYDYDGEMYHFKNDKMDIKVTPSHKMWVQKKIFKGAGEKRASAWGEWNKVRAKDMKFFDRRFRSKLNWKGKNSLKQVNVAGKNIPIKLYLEYLGYLISEGCLYTDGNNQHTTSLTQTIVRKHGQDTHKYKKMSSCMKLMSEYLDKSYSDRVIDRKDCGQEIVWSGMFCGWDIFKHFVKEINTNGRYKSKDKRIPRWVLELSPNLLKVLLNALVLGDGFTQSENGKVYYTSSKQLADDVYEAVYKIGCVPTMFVRNGDQYVIQWSETNIGEFPLVNKYSTDPRTKIKKELVSKVPYKGKVWCFTVPTGLFVTRRNGKITIQGNSQYDKDFKIFTHEAVNVERVGYNNGIVDTSGDIQQLLKEIYIGLMVPQVLMDGGGDVTYANAGVTLDVLRQRYMQFRNMLSNWLRRKIFAPISKINEFYEYKDKEKHLIVPEVEWNHMSLFDAGDYIQNISQLVQQQPQKVSVQTLYKSLGLDWEDENRKMKAEAIQNAIYKKENMSLDEMPLTELRTLTVDDEIPEPEGASGLLPGQEGGSEGGGDLAGLGLPPPPGGGGGGLPPLPGGFPGAGGEGAPPLPPEEGAAPSV